MKIKRFRRPSDDGTVDEEILRNGGFTDHELACVPHTVVWSKTQESRRFTNRFSDHGAAVHWLTICGDHGYIVHDHNLTVEVEA